MGFGGGFLVLDKPAGFTSHDLIAVMRGVLGEKGLGHTGTLDPFATGVLVVAVGPATRLIQFLEDDHKVYDCKVELGRATDTGDLTGEPVGEMEVPFLDPARIVQVLAGLQGERNHLAPRFSAVKVNGRPLYAWTREGVEVERPLRQVRIDRIELLELGETWLRIRLVCGKGTYARTVAEEIAESLGTFGHLSELRRLASGGATIETALDLPTVARAIAGEPVDDWRVVISSRSRESRAPWKLVDERRALLRPYLLPAAALFPDCQRTQPGPDAMKKLLEGGVAPPPPRGLREGQRYLAMDGPRLIGLCRVEGRWGRTLRVLPEGA